jgi:hypothetical protein
MTRPRNYIFSIEPWNITSSASDSVLDYSLLAFKLCSTVNGAQNMRNFVNKTKNMHFRSIGPTPRPSPDSSELPVPPEPGGLLPHREPAHHHCQHHRPPHQLVPPHQLRHGCRC